MSASIAAGDSGVVEADVVIVGQGPVGLLAAILMGQKGYTVLGVDRWPTPYPLPRGVTFDHEIARILSAVGIDADNDPSIDFHDAIYTLFNAEMEPLENIDWVSKAADGWRNRYWFDQPTLENRLRAIADSLPTVTRIQGFEAVHMEQDESGVTVGFRQTKLARRGPTPTEEGQVFTARGAFLLGADGANSFVRTAAGLTMTDLKFNYDWIVVDVVEHEARHYDPPHYQVCDPARPYTVVPAGPGRRRWEFMLLPGEDPENFKDPDAVWELLSRFDVRPDNAELIRHVVWRFQARYLDEWRRGRAVLAGDAAHLMPPFAGEGMCAGLRDAISLAWRLDLILQGKADQALLDTYGQERQAHAKWFIDFSVRLGEAICVTDPAAAAQRDAAMKAAWAEQSKIGPVKPYDAVLGKGVFDADNPVAGLPSAQGVVAYAGRVGRFDQVVGRGWTLITDVTAAEDLTDSVRAVVDHLGGRVITVGASGTGAAALDLDGVYADWFTRIGAKHVLVRPDYYVAGTASDDASLRRLMDQVASLAALRIPVSN